MPRRTRWCEGSLVMSSPSRIDAARGRLEHAGQQVDQRRLAGAVRADQRLARALLDLQRDVVGGGEGRRSA